MWPFMKPGAHKLAPVETNKIPISTREAALQEKLDRLQTRYDDLQMRYNLLYALNQSQADTIDELRGANAIMEGLG